MSPAPAWPLPYITPDASIGTSFGSTSSAIALPGTPANDTQVRICNLGPCAVALALGTTSAVTVTPSTGIVIMPGDSLSLGIGSNTYIAGVSCGGPSTSTVVNLTTGN